MKSERPEIQESNLLADKIESFVVKIRGSLALIIAGILALVVVLISIGVYQTIRGAQVAKGWSALYFSDTDTDDLVSIADDFPNTPAGHWARQAAGDAHLAKGVESVFVNRDVADQHYENAIKEYEKVATSTQEEFLLSRVYFGLAQAYEGAGKREEAINSYRKIASLRLEDANFIALAAQRADWLESKDGEEFFKWFAENRQVAPAIAPSMGERPALPSEPTINFSEEPQPPVSTEPSESSVESGETTEESATNQQENHAEAAETSEPTQE